MAAGIRISYIRILLFVFGYILLVSIRFNSKSSKFRKFLLASYGIFRNLSYLCPRIEAFFAYCKIQKRAEVRSFPYCYLYNIGKRQLLDFQSKSNLERVRFVNVIFSSFSRQVLNRRTNNCFFLRIEEDSLTH